MNRNLPGWGLSPRNQPALAGFEQIARTFTSARVRRARPSDICLRMYKPGHSRLGMNPSATRTKAAQAASPRIARFSGLRTNSVDVHVRAGTARRGRPLDVRIRACAISIMDHPGIGI